MKKLMCAPVPLVLGIAMCLGLSGCGNGHQLETAPVQGTVLYQGKPLPYGTISFQPQAGPPAMGKIQADGSFRLSTYGNSDGALVGPHKVLITATANDAGTVANLDANTEMQVSGSVIPTKYTSFSTSGLTAEVTAGQTNQLVFELSGAAPKPSTEQFDSV